jgi:hypothetical protein
MVFLFRPVLVWVLSWSSLLCVFAPSRASQRVRRRVSLAAVRMRRRDSCRLIFSGLLHCLCRTDRYENRPIKSAGQL